MLFDEDLQLALFVCYELHYRGWDEVAHRRTRHRPGAATGSEPSGSVVAGRATVALCRCGLSTAKPFCDGTHKAAGFRAPSGRQEPPAS